MARVFGRSFLVALSLAAALTGCSPGPLIDKLPSEMGLPAGAPARPPENNQYPAVHDMPLPRAAPTMNEEQQVKLEKDLAAARDQQESREGAEKKAAQPKKKKPADAKNSPAAGVKDGTKDGVKTNP